MWNEVVNNSDLTDFMEMVGYFHDSCIKEMRYLSGAYVTEQFAMHPINDCRVLWVVIQRQSKSFSMIEMEFRGLKYLKLLPIGEGYTCELLDATMIMNNEGIHWCDCGGVTEANLENYNGTVICSEKFRWRSINNCMGSDEFYKSVQ